MIGLEEDSKGFNDVNEGSESCERVEEEKKWEKKQK